MAPKRYCFYVAVFIFFSFRLCSSANKSEETTAAPHTTNFKTGNISSHRPQESTKSFTASTVKPGPTNPPSNSSNVKCKGESNCRGCTENIRCYWCESTKKCAVYPAKKIAPRDCPKNDWKWKQCVIPGYVLIILVPSLAGLILLTCGCCIYCKCCRGNKKGWKKTDDRIRQRRLNMEQQHEMRRKERKARQDAIRKKYGLLKDDDDEPLI